MMKRQAIATLTVLVLAAFAAIANAQPRQPQQPQKPTQSPQPNFATVEIRSLQVRDNLYMLVGAGGNITMQVGADGILLVDTQYAPLSNKILAAIRKISDKPIRYIIDTHHHGDHTGGNSNLRAAGSTVTGGN